MAVQGPVMKQHHKMRGGMAPPSERSQRQRRPQASAFEGPGGGVPPPLTGSPANRFVWGVP